VVTLKAVAAAPVSERDTLVTRIVAGDRSAARTFYDEHSVRIHRLVYRMVGDAHLTHDLLQEIFLRAFRALPDFREESSLSTWLHRIALNVTLNALRQRKRERLREVAANDAQTLEIHMADTALSEASQDPGLSGRVMRAALALPENLRVVLVMHEVEGYTHSEIAAALDVPEGTSRAHLSTARSRLRQSLAALQEN
jgi:RNA polymerase sigma-70 factor (ECF subfamily)